jgi:hypothetical protein
MKRLLLVLAIAFLLPVSAFADVCRAFTTGGGYARYLPTTAKSLATSTPDGGVTIPANVTGAVLFVNGAPIRYRTDGVDPTSAEGVQVPAGFAIFFDEKTANQLYVFRFIQVSSGAEVTVSYCNGTGR